MGNGGGGGGEVVGVWLCCRGPAKKPWAPGFVVNRGLLGAPFFFIFFPRGGNPAPDQGCQGGDRGGGGGPGPL